MKLKSGKEEIVYLLARVFEKYESETGNLITRNTNRKNYEAVSKKLSEISNQLPYTADTLDHDVYSPDYNPNKLEYPSRKYDITASQVKDASLGLVNNPRPFLVEACYIYIYSVGRKGFGKNPKDSNMVIGIESPSGLSKLETLTIEINALKKENEALLQNAGKSYKKIKQNLSIVLTVVFAAMLFSAYQWISTRNKWNTVKKDMNLLPYQPTQAEIDSLEGVWLCYTGSPQARSSDPNRFHLVVSNVVDIRYKDGYFIYNRYGASFNHIGYAQFEAPYLVSLHSHIKNNTGDIESPRHSLMQLNNERKYLPVISASWSFDVGARNNIVGIREVYIKQGKGGAIEEVINTVENASCKCKIVTWHQVNDSLKTFHLKNQLLDSIAETPIKTLLDENSIILRKPQQGLILGKRNDTKRR
ncbi:hypothetical protein FAM09_20655 [Niastella caeni]|uniref:Uncharacterized protein n=1 Tax=Niastella caeni TaxID=2569763 RepID=A0A4S8HPI8_9BACT|nr:hypothetical protein [Niastella caeni]THU35814.1 hypothetical protein FAM09_20655 [Niastella caeni]